MDGSHGLVLPAVTSAVEEIYTAIIKQWTGDVYYLDASDFTLPPAPNSNSETLGSPSQKPSLFVVNLPTSYDQFNDEHNRTGK
jgi:hypothetical protein